MAYSSGKNAYGICDISGFRYKLKDMKRTWNGLLVGPDMFDSKHPQLEPKRFVADPESLLNPRPETKNTVGLGVVKTSTPNMLITNDLIGSSFSGYETTARLGTVTITTS